MNKAIKYIQSLSAKSWFFLLLIGMSFMYSYHKTSFLPPQSMHKWRQSDVASITLNYYQNGMRFFMPELHNQLGDEGRSGYAVGECPVLYYFVAVLYTIFGPYDFIFKLVNLALLYLGLFYLFKLYRLFIDDSFWSVCGALLVFTSPALVYYGNNFLTDPSSLSLSFIAWFHLAKLWKSGLKKHLYFAFLFFTLAGLLKILSLTHVLAFLLVLLIDFFFSKKNKAFPAFKRDYFLVFSAYFLLIFSWYAFSIYYNRLHQTDYFLSKTNAIWTFPMHELKLIFETIRTDRFREYFAPYSQFMFIALLLLSFIYLKKGKKLILALSLFLFFGALSVAALWFYQLRDHDYYSITQLGFPAAIVLSSILMLRTHFPRFFRSILLKSAFFVFLLLNVFHAKKINYTRYYGWYSADLAQEFAYYTIRPYLDSLGISRKDKAIVFPDYAPCFPLYVMNQQGFSGYNVLTESEEGLKKLIEKGAGYLLYRGPIQEKHAYLKPFMKTKTGQYFNVAIYSLNEDSIAFRPAEFKYNFELYADLEKNSGSKFSTTLNKQTLSGAERKDSLRAYSGKYSVKTDSLNPFALNLLLKKVKRGDVYTVSVKRHRSNKEALLVVSDRNAKRFYLKTDKGEPCKEDNNWEKLSLTFYCHKSLTKDQLRIYVWNPGNKSAWFDDLEVKKIHMNNKITR